MHCPFCSAPDTQVKDSRERPDGKSIKRRRVCGECGSRFNTIEMLEVKEMVVIKRDGSKRPLDRNKIFKSISVATRKRSISNEQIESLVDRIFTRIEKSGETEIQSKAIGEMIMEELQKLDQVSYVRFASVYQEFTEAKDFQKFLNHMNDKINQ